MGPRKPGNPARSANIDGPEAFAGHFAVSRETLARLETYAALLARWQKAHNLVAPGTLDTLWHRHMADSAQLMTLAPDARRWLDLGSGGGFPGMVLAILLMDESFAGAGQEAGTVTLVEATARKCAFLGAVKRATGAPAEIVNARIEDAAKRIEGPFDAVTARALAPLETLLPLAAPWLAGSGGAARGIFLKGQDIEAELTAASRYWKIVYELRESLTDSNGRILMVTSLGPRRVGGEGDNEAMTP